VSGGHRAFVVTRVNAIGSFEIAAGFAAFAILLRFRFPFAR
jgi:hypothetical protein